MMLAVFARIEPARRKSITFDNDTAFAQHALLRTMRAMTTWFCDAYASRQKGGIENANGRLRRWLPRCLVRWTSTKCPTRKSRTLSSPPISRPENAWASIPPDDSIECIPNLNQLIDNDIANREMEGIPKDSITILAGDATSGLSQVQSVETLMGRRRELGKDVQIRFS